MPSVKMLVSAQPATAPYLRLCDDEPAQSGSGQALSEGDHPPGTFSQPEVALNAPATDDTPGPAPDNIPGTESDKTSDPAPDDTQGPAPDDTSGPALDGTSGPSGLVPCQPTTPPVVSTLPAPTKVSDSTEKPLPSRSFSLTIGFSIIAVYVFPPFGIPAIILAVTARSNNRYGKVTTAKSQRKHAISLLILSLTIGICIAGSFAINVSFFNDKTKETYWYTTSDYDSYDWKGPATTTTTTSYDSYDWERNTTKSYEWFSPSSSPPTPTSDWEYYSDWKRYSTTSYYKEWWDTVTSSMADTWDKWTTTRRPWWTGNRTEDSYWTDEDGTPPVTTAATTNVTTDWSNSDGPNIGNTLPWWITPVRTTNSTTNETERNYSDTTATTATFEPTSTPYELQDEEITPAFFEYDPDDFGDE